MPVPQLFIGFRGWSNDRVDWYNSRIRAQLYGVDAEPFLLGERVITRDNVKVSNGSIPAWDSDSIRVKTCKIAL